MLEYNISILLFRFVHYIFLLIFDSTKTILKIFDSYFLNMNLTINQYKIILK
ncbi:hypothetical protein JCM21142_41441 [Saccharicrinis fermentans DSM 9555 = JCM 21142]|uniref:Uncharacterized protein n=1 Tax=Saccharicrinis fermentans DSM 9555 = JCM 21142 TaxID=869213 RepID=W7YEA3_9BACT|nr:hypothetical protein JCM21142_41441 [Saccharicrinis fermentans DSM 9555 = JCM 21142]